MWTFRVIFPKSTVDVPVNSLLLPKNMMSIGTSNPLREAAFYGLDQGPVASDSWSGIFDRQKNSRLLCVPVR